MIDNPLLAPYIGERCPWCLLEYETATDLKGARFGAGAAPVHAACWDAYTGRVVQDVRALAASILSKKVGRHITLTEDDLALLRQWARPIPPP